LRLRASNKRRGGFKRAQQAGLKPARLTSRL